MIDKMLDCDDDKAQWNMGWQRFFDIYHPLLRSMVRKTFARYSLSNVPESALNDVITDVFVSMIKTFQEKKFDRNAHFRGFIKSLVLHKCVDYMRKHKRQIMPFEFGAEAEKELEFQASLDSQDWDEEEEKYFRLGLLRETLECIRFSFSPQTITIFELIKLDGKSPQFVMKELGVSRSVVDNSVYKVMKKLRSKISENNIKNYDNEIL